MRIRTGNLRRITPAAFGSILELDSGDTVQLNLTPNDVEHFLANSDICDFRDLSQISTIQIANPVLRMTSNEWAIISSVLLSSDAAAEIRGIPELAGMLTLPFEELIQLPNHLRGSIQEPNSHGMPTLWIRHPFDFRGDSYDDHALRLCHLYARGGRVFRTFIDLNSAAIRVKDFHHDGFFVEPQPDA